MKLSFPFKKARKEVGLPPGTLVYTGEEKKIPKLTLTRYSETEHKEISSESFEEIEVKIDKKTVNWINIDGLADVGLIEKIGKSFDIHHLALEDVLNLEHLPKVEYYDDYVFLTFKMLKYNEEDQSVEAEHMSCFLGDGYLISLQERVGDVFNRIRERLATETSRARKKKADYLLYLMIDSAVDNYYLIVDRMYDKIADLEKDLLENPTQDSLEKINEYKKRLMLIRRYIYPLMEVVRKLTKSDSAFIDSYLDDYFSDVSDHIQDVIAHLEIQRETLYSFFDLYNSTVGNKLNQVMKSLTVIATIFIPLTFIAGVYGMNFKFMPELDWRWGYPIILICMAVIGVSMFFYMKKKHWF